MIRSDTKALLNKRQVAEYLGVKVFTMDAWVSQRRIPFIKIGRLVGFNPDEIHAWLEEQKVPAQLGPPTSKRA